jgi:hypothetical protein
MALSWLAVRPRRRAALRLTTAAPVSTAVQTPSGKNNFTPVRNSFRIDRAMSGTQTLPGTGVVGALTRPVTGNASKDRLLARESY